METLDLLGIYGLMYRSRLFEEHVVQIWNDGLITGEMHTGIGEEAINAGVVAQLEDGDALALDHSHLPFHHPGSGARGSVVGVYGAARRTLLGWLEYRISISFCRKSRSSLPGFWRSSVASIEKRHPIARSQRFDVEATLFRRFRGPADGSAFRAGRRVAKPA